MKIQKIIINNFRAFKHAEIVFDEFNCIIGKNDAGKSTILAALEWFFDPNKELNDNDFAAAGFDWTEIEESFYDEELDEVTTETHKKYFYDDLYASVDVYFGEVTIPERSEEYEFIFNKDFLSNDGAFCLSKYMYHSPDYVYPPTYQPRKGYRIKKYYFNKIGKLFSDCSFDELKSAYAEIGKDAEELCVELKKIEDTRKRKRGVAASALTSKIREEQLGIRSRICDELYNYYYELGEIICDDQWIPVDDIYYSGIPFYIDFPVYKLYTSKTPIKEYLNELFTPFNAGKVYKTIEEAKLRTARKLSEYLELDDELDYLDYKKNEKIDLFTDNSLVFKQGDLPLSIPLENRGEGLQLKIKNAVFRLLTEIQSKDQVNMVFAFEEPEAHLHPAAQLEMYKTIKALSKNPNYQVIITTHSPYIVKELEDDENSSVIIVTHDKEKMESRISHLEEAVLPYKSINEVNFIAFEEPSIEYHIELYGYIQQKEELQPEKVDDWLFNNNYAERKHIFFKISKTGQLISDKKNGCLHELKTLPYCVRNQINHPHNKNKQYDDKRLVKESIEIMRNAIKTHYKNSEV